MNVDFELDRFQVEAIAALDAGESVVVAAPTGAGKTVVADAAIDRALATGNKVFYTTPVKALSNQKFRDLAARLGPARVGLLTGDNNINASAPIVVMTTEVLRNMLYSGSRSLGRLSHVVLDEVHFLQDTYRGPVWEEVILDLDPSVRLVCLSATVSNAEELGEWIRTVRGPTTLVTETERPIALHPLYLVGDRHSEVDHLVPVLVDGLPNADAHRFDQRERPRGGSRGPGGRRRGRPRSRFAIPRRIETVERLGEERLLPAIYFIFSRKACDDAMAACRDGGVRLTDRAERAAIREIVEDSVVALSDDDLDALDYDLWAEGMQMGIASHHAGLVPAFKEATERCFVEGLVKVVFATETLALGINMPARSVVIEKLTKFNGDTHEFLTPAQFTQLTGRAGRRGLDDVGHAVICWSPFVSFNQVAELVQSREFPLRSAFRATYNMAANLVRRLDRDDALALLQRSFAQFQADRELVAAAQAVEEDTRRLERLEEYLTCDLGDAREYAELVQQASRRAPASAARGAVDAAVRDLRPGDVVVAEQDHGAELVVVVSVAMRGRSGIRVKAVGADGSPVLLEREDFESPPRPVASVDLPDPYAPSDPAFLRSCAELVSALDVPAPSERRTAAQRARDRLEHHPVAACPDAALHSTAFGDHDRLRRQVERRQRRLARRASSVADRFHRVITVLESSGCVAEWALTARGRLLAGIYHESDLLVALAVDDRVFDGLGPAEVAAVVAAVTYEERRPEGAPRPRRCRSAEVERRIDRLDRLRAELLVVEQANGVEPTRAPDRGFVDMAYRWAGGSEFSEVLGDRMTGGDFVRNARLVVDLLRQIAEVAPDVGTRTSAAEAADAISRGVVADTASSLGAPADEDADDGSDAAVAEG